MRHHSTDLDTPVAEVMTWPVLSGSPNQTLLEVRNVFERRGINHLPIVDEASVPVGMVSQSDLARLRSWRAYFQPAQQALSHERLLGSLLVSEVMRAPVVTLRDSATVMAAARLIDGRRLHCIVVVSDIGQLVGVVTAHDLLRLAYPPLPSLIAEVGQVRSWFRLRRWLRLVEWRESAGGRCAVEDFSPWALIAQPGSGRWRSPSPDWPRPWRTYRPAASDVQFSVGR